MSIWRWAEQFGGGIGQPDQLTLGEGDTPLLRSRHIGPALGANQLFFKLETVNPTGSYKDRFAAVAISDMVAKGKRRCIATSSGNTGSALAAYCAAAGLMCEIAVVEPAPQEKLKQMMAYGAMIYRVRGFGISPDITEATFRILTNKASAPDAALQISAFCCSAAGMGGVKTIAYELLEQCSELENVFIPAGGGGLTLAVARGFAQAQPELRTRIHCVQPDGNDTIATPLRAGATSARDVKSTTQISGLQVSSVLDGHDVITACRASGGTGYLISDSEIWAVQAALARHEGIFCEPAGAVSVAGALAALETGEVSRDSHICCIITGSGFKDSTSVSQMVGSDCPLIAPEEVMDFDAEKVRPSSGKR